jgi:hypothetical protein
MISAAVIQPQLTNHCRGFGVTVKQSLNIFCSASAPISQRVGAGGGSLFQDYCGEHSSSFGVVGLAELDDFSDDE